MYLDSDQIKPIKKTTSRGTVFTSERANLTLDVKVMPSRMLSLKEWLAECTEFVAWHALVIRPTLNGFAGYDTVTYEVLPNFTQPLTRD